jgi:hypothetical protein
MIADVKINVQVGSGRRKQFSITKSRLLDDIGATLVGEWHADNMLVYTGTVLDRLDAVAAECQTLGRQEIEKLMPFIANQMIGQETPGSSNDSLTLDLRTLAGGGSIDFGGAGSPVVTWKGLSDRWRRKKWKGKNPKNEKKFFLDTGALQNLFLRFGTRTWMKLGDVEVTVRREPVENIVRRGPKHGGHFRIASLDIVIGREFTNQSFGGLDGGSLWGRAPSMSLARKLGFSSTSIQKLVGNPHVPDSHRPMLAPAVAYWYFFKVPHLIRQKMERALTRATNSVLRSTRG